MRNFKRILFVLLALFTLFIYAACDYLEEEVNNATAQTKSFSEDLKPGIPIKGVGGACSPQAVSFDALLSSVSVWDTVKEHIEEVNINALLYTIDPNENASDGKVDVYITDSGDYFSGDQGAPPDSERVGSTDTLVAGKVYENEDLQYASGGKETLEDLMIQFDQSFYICVGWDGNEEDVDMTFMLSIDVDVVFVPL